MYEDCRPTIIRKRGAMQYKVIISKSNKTFPVRGLNELLAGRMYDYRTKKYHNRVKSDNDKVCRLAIQKYLKDVKFTKQMFIFVKMETVKITIDGIELEVPKTYTILDAALEANIDIPTLCYLKDVNGIGACRMCIVEVEGARGFVTSCVYPVSDGMVVRTNTKAIREARKVTLELLLSNHDNNCVTCVRSTNCELQSLSKKLGVKDIRFEGERNVYDVDENFDYERIKIGDGIKNINELAFVDENHTHDWNDIQNKPFITVNGDTLEWYGNTEGIAGIPHENLILYNRRL